MNAALKPRQPRWRVTEETAVRLAFIRRERGCKSWDEFFQMMIIQFAQKSSPESDPVPLPPAKRVLIQLDHLHQSQAKILTSLEAQNETSHATQTILEETHRLLNALKALLELAIKLEDPGEESPVNGNRPASKLRQHIQRRS